MFQDFCGETYGFEPVPEKDKVLSESCTQTSKRSTEDQGTQTKVSAEIQIQTEVETTEKTVEYDSARLSAFLNRIYPELSEELEKFEDYYVQNSEAEEEDSSVTRLHLIEPQEIKDKKVSCLSWSCTGVTLAVSHCAVTHEGWCTHDGTISLYNTSKQNFESLPPAQVLRMVSCVTSIAFHPWEPSVLAAGLYSGEVVVWDLRHDEEQMLLKKQKENSDANKHLNVVSFVTWTEDVNGPLLVSTGQDGRIFVWKISFANKTLQVQHRLLISTEYSKHNIDSFGLEVTSIAFWKKIEDEFIVSTDGGGVLHCSMRASRSIPSHPDFSDPVVVRYQSHKGIVTHVNCSQDSLFASCGTDCEIHVYKSREPEVLHLIHTDFSLLGVQWTELAHVVMCWGASRDVECYRVTSEEKIPQYTLSNETECQVTAAKWNSARSGVVALGTESGSISVWSFPKVNNQ